MDGRLIPGAGEGRSRAGRTRARPRHRGRVLTAVALAGLFGCVVVSGRPARSAPAGGSLPAATPASCPDTPGQQLLERVNRIRVDRGLEPLTADSGIVDAALRHTEDQAAVDSISHYGPDGSTSGERIRRAGYDWTLAAENVGAGYAGASAMVEAWMGSPPHRSTILEPDARHAGVGFVYRPDSRLRYFWTLDVAEPGNPGTVRELACHP